MEAKKIEREVRISMYVVVGMFFLLPFVYFLWFWIIKKQSLSEVAGNWGTFGDFVGGILNPLVAGAAFYWLTRSVLIQKTELEATKEALEASQRAQHDQAVTLQLQKFETTFFSLLEQHNQTLGTLTAKPTNASELGVLSLDDSVIRDIHREVFAQGVVGEARICLERNNILCGHYFRILYQVLKYIATKCPGGAIGASFEERDIAESPMAADEKFYSNIVRSFLNYEVTQLLAINCCVEDSADTYYKYKLLVERYSMLEHMPFEQESDGAKIPALIGAAHAYRKIAFGDSEFLSHELKEQLKE